MRTLRYANNADGVAIGGNRMRNLLSVTCALAGALTLPVWQYAFACTPPETFYTPSNFELVQEADAIVVAVAVREEKGDSDDTDDTDVVFQVDSVLKGLPPSEVRQSRSRLGQPVKSDPGTIWLPHPDGYSGTCLRTTFQKGEKYVLFLEAENDATYVVALFPRTRVNEDFYGLDSLWMRTIFYYLNVQKSYDSMEQLDALKQRYKQLVGPQLNEIDRQLAINIWVHLNYISPFKPTPYLVDTWTSLSEGLERPYTVDWHDSLSELGSDDYDVRLWTGGPTSYLKRQSLLSLAIGNHPNAMSLFDELSKRALPSAVEIGAAARFFSRHDRYADAFDLTNEHALRLLASASPREASDFYSNVQHLGHFPDDYETRRWQTDNYVQPRWPELIHAMNLVIESRYGLNITLVPEEEVRALRPKNYRSRPDVTLILARLQDEEVVAWATEQLTSYLEHEDEIEDELLELPVDVLIGSYGLGKEELRPTVERFFCSNENIRFKMITRIGLQPNHHTEHLLFRFAGYDNLEKHEWANVVDAIAMFVSADQRAYLLRAGWRPTDAHKLLLAFVKGEPIVVRGEFVKKYRQPIVCP